MEVVKNISADAVVKTYDLNPLDAVRLDGDGEKAVEILKKYILNELENILKINWFATLKLNLKVFPLKELFKCPILVYRGFSINEFKGEIIFNAPIQFGILVFGQPYEIFTKSGNKGEAVINGTLIINGRVQFGIDTKNYKKKEITRFPMQSQKE